MAKRPLPDWDDGRVIANMDVEGMPWNNRPAYLKEAVAHLRKEKTARPKDEMTAKEARWYTAGAVKAGLAVVGVLAAGIVLFILFCQLVWFK